MRRASTLRLLAAVPAVGLAVAAVALTAGAFADGSPALTTLPRAADAVAPAPENLSPANTTRDWQEVQGSVVVRPAR